MREIYVIRTPSQLASGLQCIMTGGQGRAINDVLHCLSTAWEWYIIGGAVSDRFLQNDMARLGDRIDRIQPSGDVDIILTGVPSTSALAIALAPLQPRQNRFGGFKIQLSEHSFPVDIWRVEDHVHWRHPRAHTIEDAIDLCALDIGAIAWSPQRDVVVDGGCRSAVFLRQLELDRLSGMGRGQTRVLAASYVLTTAFKYRHVLSIGTLARTFLQQVLNSSDSSALLDLFMKRIAEKHVPADDIPFFLKHLTHTQH